VAADQAITRLLMRICATRLDPAVTGTEFVQLLETLLDRAMAATSQDLVAAELAAGIEDPPDDPPEDEDPPAPPRFRRRMLYDDKVRIRMAADEARGDGQYLPKGWVRAKAAEHHVSEQTIYNALKGD
jgi:hypothetical protein